MQRKTLAGLGLALLMASATGLRAEEALAPQAPDQPPMGAQAQGPGGPPSTAPDDAQGPGGGMMGGGMDGDPGQAFEELKDQLGLSADQADKLKAIGEDARTKNQGHRKAMMDLIKTLDGLVQAKAGDTGLQAALDKIKAEHKAMQADRDAAMDQREAVLTPLQAAKFVLAMRDKMRQGMLRRMRQGGAGQGQGGPGPDQQ